MGSFLGILFCGGRGMRLGNITEYISKAFMPVYDRPVFMYPLAQLEVSEHIDEILLLTNQENDEKLRRTGYKTIVQDDEQVHDMFSGLRYLRMITGDDRAAVLMPCDNISEIIVDDVINVFLRDEPDIAFSIRNIEAKAKLREMGVFNPTTGVVEYRPSKPKSNWGVIAPYVVRDRLQLSGREEPEILNRCRLSHTEYAGPWFDIGDVRSWIEANKALSLTKGRAKDQQFFL